MPDLRPWDDLAGMAVLQRLDTADQFEAELMHGHRVSSLELFADWRNMQAIALGSWVVRTSPRAGSVPFAVLLIAGTGQVGVAQAALLARDHARFRRDLAQLGAMLRVAMPGWAAERGLNRIEARAWIDHPSACGFLRALGFVCEAEMPGFGLSGLARFGLFAWVSPAVLYPSHHHQTQPQPKES